MRIAPVLSHGDAHGKNLRPFTGSGGSMEYFAYILQSESYGTYYYGSAEDLEIRLKRHNAGKVRSTKAKRPWRLHYKEPFRTRSEAYKRELFFKSVGGYKFLKERGII